MPTLRIDVYWKRDRAEEFGSHFFRALAASLSLPGGFVSAKGSD